MADFEDASARDARMAAELSADIGAEHIATVYAKALLGAAGDAPAAQAALEQFQSLVEDILRHFPRFGEILSAALVSPEDKLGVLDRVFGGRASPLLLNFLKVVARHGRLDCLGSIYREARHLFDERHGRVPVQLTLAAPVDAAVTERLTAKLRQVLGADPVITQKVDPKLIAGAVVRVGDTIYDGSIANQLKILRQQISDRSAHEIQSRRDRFRYPAGN